MKFFKRYCSQCGNSMIGELRPAEENIMHYGDTETIPFASPYDPKTGKRQYCMKYTCSMLLHKGKQIFFGGKHDEYFVDKVLFDIKS